MLNLVSSILPIADKVLDRVIPDKNAKQKALLEMESMLVEAETKGQLAQIEVNKEEAKSGSFFRGGWRPATGWCCVLALFYNYVAQPIAVFVLGHMGSLVLLPSLDMTTMMPILLGMLGLAGARSFERIKGKA